MQRLRLGATLLVATLCAAAAGCSFDAGGLNQLGDGDGGGGDDDVTVIDAAVVDASTIDVISSDDAAPVDAPVPTIDATLPTIDAAAPPDAPPPPPPDAALPSDCGNGTIDPLEQCDDGGIAPGDGCDANCQWEPLACGAGTELSTITPGVSVTGSNTGQMTIIGGGGACGGSQSGEDVYTLDLDVRADLTVTTELPGTNYRTSIYVRSDCDDVASQLGCASAGPLGDTLDLRAVEPGTYFVVVDGLGGATGNYELRVDVVPVIALGGSCDPAGLADRCETGTSCMFSVATGFICVADAQVCEANATPLTLSLATTTAGMTSGTGTYQPSCSASASGPETTYSVDVGAGGARDLMIDVSGSGALDAVVELDGTCGDPASSRACSQTSGAPGAELAVVLDVAPGRSYLTVDGADGSEGSYGVQAWLRNVVGGNAACDREQRAFRCSTGVCVDHNDADQLPSCRGGVPVITEAVGNFDPCMGFDGPASADFVYSAGMTSGNDIDVVQLTPAANTRVVVSVAGANGTCPVDLRARILTGDCMNPTPVVASDDDGIGPCPFIDVNLQGGQVYWLRIDRAASFGTGDYTAVVDFIP